jgi:hypothetical protein
MIQLGPGGQRWLKLFHVIFASLWVGGAIGINLMGFFLRAEDGMQLYGITLSMKFIDDFIIIPGATGSFATGLLYSMFTGWGWFRHRWITVKWLINLYGVIFGTFFLGPWLNSLPPMARDMGIQALSDPVYTGNLNMLYRFGTFQAATIVFAVYLSVMKPWKRPKAAA